MREKLLCHISQYQRKCYERGKNDFYKRASKYSAVLHMQIHVFYPLTESST